MRHGHCSGFAGRHGADVGRPSAGRVTDAFYMRGYKGREDSEFAFRKKTMNSLEYFMTKLFTNDCF
jgi:hypothetical protein